MTVSIKRKWANDVEERERERERMGVTDDNEDENGSPTRTLNEKKCYKINRMQRMPLLLVAFHSSHLDTHGHAI